MIYSQGLMLATLVVEVVVVVVVVVVVIVVVGGRAPCWPLRRDDTGGTATPKPYSI